MVANYLLYKNGEFPDYDQYNREMEAHLAQDLADIEKECDAWAYDYAKKKAAFAKERPDLPHYFIGAGNQYGATYSTPCATGRSSCGSGQSPSAAGSSSTACRRSSWRTPR